MTVSTIGSVPTDHPNQLIDLSDRTIDDQHVTTLDRRFSSSSSGSTDQLNEWDSFLVDRRPKATSEKQYLNNIERGSNCDFIRRIQ